MSYVVFKIFLNFITNFVQMAFYKKLIMFLTALLLVGCYQTTKPHQKYRNNFSTNERKQLAIARQIINRSYYASLVTMDHMQPKIRLMEPFAPEDNFTIYLATNPKSRKVKEIQNNPVAALHYIDKPRVGYVSLYGKAYIVDNDSLKKKYWRVGWEKFYPDKKSGYLLIKFVPDYIEVVSPKDGLPGDAKTWQPESINLYKK